MSILSGLTHLERCLFPGDFKKELMELGMEKFDANEFSAMIKKGKGIVELYQYAEGCNEPYKTKFCNILDEYVDNWMNEFNHLKETK